MYKNSKKGFTLVELVVVMVILAILFKVLIPQISNIMNKSKVTGVETNFRDFSTAAQAVAYEQSGFYGDGKDTTVMDQLNEYLDAANALDGATDSAATFKTAKDPWNKPYNVVIGNKDADGHTTSDRGYVMFYSGGKNGVVKTAPTATYTDRTGFEITKDGDDLVILVGYDENGSVVTLTEGFSRNIE